MQVGKAKLHRGTAAVTYPRGKVRTTPKTEKGPEYGGVSWDALLGKGVIKPVQVPRVVNVAVNGTASKKNYVSNGVAHGVAAA